MLYDEYGEHLDHTTASRLWNMVEGLLHHALEELEDHGFQASSSGRSS